MTIAEQLYKKLRALSETSQLEALHYIDFLVEKQDKAGREGKSKKAQDWMKMMSQTQHAYSDIDPLVWQKEQRTDKSLPYRD